MNTYEGVCRYCGSIVSIMANSQEEADQLVTEKCTCEASELDRKRDCLMKNIEDICENSQSMRAMEREEIDAVLLIGAQMFKADINSVQIGFDHSGIRIWKAGDKIKVKRTAKVEQTRAISKVS